MEIYETNVFGTVATIQAMLPLAAGEAGRIVNVSSHLGSLCLTRDQANPMSQFLAPD